MGGRKGYTFPWATKNVFHSWWGKCELMTCRGPPVRENPHCLVQPGRPQVKNTPEKPNSKKKHLKILRCLENASFGIFFTSSKKPPTPSSSQSEDRKHQAKTMPGTAFLKLPALQRFSDPPVPPMNSWFLCQL